MSYMVKIRRNGQVAGYFGPYSAKSAADQDRRYLATISGDGVILRTEQVTRSNPLPALAMGAARVAMYAPAALKGAKKGAKIAAKFGPKAAKHAKRLRKGAKKAKKGLKKGKKLLKDWGPMALAALEAAEAIAPKKAKKKIAKAKKSLKKGVARTNPVRFVAGHVIVGDATDGYMITDTGQSFSTLKEARAKASSSPRSNPNPWAGKNRPSSQIQTLLFAKKGRHQWTLTQAKKWLKEKGFKYGKVDETENYLRFRQMEPGLFDPTSFRTEEWKLVMKRFGDAPRKSSMGVKAIYGIPHMGSSRPNRRKKKWVQAVDKSMEKHHTVGLFTAKARAAGYSDTMKFARVVAITYRQWMKKRDAAQRAGHRAPPYPKINGVVIDLKTQREAQFALNVTKRFRENP